MHSFKIFALFWAFLACALSDIAQGDIIVPWDISDADVENAATAVNAAMGSDWDAAYHYADLAGHDVADLIEWLKIQNDCPDGSKIREFVATHSDWPRVNALQKVSYEVVNILDRVAYSCDGRTKKSVFLNYHLLSKDAYLSRAEDLLWSKRPDLANKMLYNIPDEHSKVLRARIALQKNIAKAESYFKAVPAELRNNLGLKNDYLFWYARNKGIDQVALDILIGMQENESSLGRLWKINKYYVREILYNQKSDHYRAAYNLVKKQAKSGNSEALWLAGWIAMHHMEDPALAYTHFSSLYRNSKSSANISRAAYWAAKSAEASGRIGMAFRWYKIASLHKTTFYGQLSLFKTGITSFKLDDSGTYSAHDYLNCHNNKFAKLSYLALQIGDQSLSKTFMHHAIARAKSVGEIGVITELSIENNMPSVAMSGAMTAESFGMIIPKSLYPVYETVERMDGIDHKVVLSVIRQESRFNKVVKGLAGELGLMQIMPNTAKGVAQNLGLEYKEKHLIDPKYNVTLGDAYLKKLFQKYDDSLILAFAAYNAGLGNVGKWIKKIGDPRTLKNIDDRIVWIERIPFDTTRDYVQKVIGNLQIYSSILDAGGGINYLDKELIK